MIRYFVKPAVMLAVAGISGGALWCQDAAKGPQYKDRAEYDVVVAATKEADGAKALGLLNTWKEKYPETEFKEMRAQLYVQTYQKLNQGENMLKAAQEWMAINPSAVPPKYWITLLTVSLDNTTPDRLALGEKAAHGLLSYIDVELAPGKRPADKPPADWDKERNTLTALAVKTLGWIEMARKNYTKAEAELSRFLKLNPNSGVVSYWLANQILAQKVVEKQETALYHFARAGWYTGEEALPDGVKKQVQGFFEKTYKNFHGSDDGMKEVVELALKSPFPPADFDIESAIEIAVRQENELKEKNPQLAIWLGMKKNLLGPTGGDYFNAMKGAAISEKMKGKVVGQAPARRPKEITVALSTNDTEEIKLILDAPMVNPAEPGTEIEFANGVAQAFSTEPFLLTLEIEKANVTGWPAAARPAPKARKKK